MDILQVVIIAIVATLLIAVIKAQRPELAILLSVAAGVLILAFAAAYLDSIVSILREITSRVNLDLAFVNIILKIVAVAYLCEFGAQVCKDAGEAAIATKVELAGKILIVYLASPILLSLLNLLTSMF